MVLYEGYNYGNPGIIDSHYNNTYNRLNSLQGNVQVMYNQSNPTTNPGGFELLGAFGTVFKAMISVIGLIFDSLTGLSSQVGSIGQDIGMPQVLANLIFPAFLAIITVIIVLIILNSGKFGKL